MNIATSADGYVARLDGNLDWLTDRPAPKHFYGLPEFERSTDAKILGRKTFDKSLQMGARFSASAVHYVSSLGGRRLLPCPRVSASSPSRSLAYRSRHTFGSLAPSA